MPRPLTERLAELRQEIALICAMNHSERSSLPYQYHEPKKQRRAQRFQRAQRLQEIMDELQSLTGWKKP